MLITTVLSPYVTLDDQFNVNVTDGSPGCAYSISVTPDQLSKLQPSVNKPFDAVLILTQYKGVTYVIVYATQEGRIGDFLGIFQKIVSSVRFASARYAKIKFELERCMLDEFNLLCRERHIQVEEAIIELIEREVERYSKLEELR